MFERAGLLTVLLLLFVSTVSAQTIYKWKDERGRWHFSNTPPPRSDVESIDVRSRPRDIVEGSGAVEIFRSKISRKPSSW